MLRTRLRGQTYEDEPSPNADFRRFLLTFAVFSLLLENKALGKRRFSRKTADFRGKPQIFSGTRRKPQIGVCPLRFAPLSVALVAPNYCSEKNLPPGKSPAKASKSSTSKIPHSHVLEEGKRPPTPTHSVSLSKRPVLLRADFVLTGDPRPLYYKTPPCLFYHKIALS